MERQNLQSLENFDFLARCLAKMCTQGRPVNVQAVIGNMNDEQKLWFQKRYECYLKQGEEEKIRPVEH